MRGFLIALLIAALLGAGAAFWTAARHTDRVNARFNALQAELQTEQHARATDLAAAAAADRVRVVERTIQRGVTDGQTQITAAMGSRALVSADAGGAWRDAIRRLRDGAPDPAGAEDNHPAAGPN